MEFKIEKNVPLETARARSSKYPFAQMEVGDSFLVPLNGTGESQFRAFAASWKAHKPKKFVSRTIKENGVRTGIRVWRTE